MHRLPKGVKDPRRQAGRTELSQTNNYPSWSPSQEVTSTTSLNNSFQGLITFPCRKFFLSSQLSPSCCPVSPNGWVSFPSPTLWSQEQDRDQDRVFLQRHFCPTQWQGCQDFGMAVTMTVYDYSRHCRSFSLQPQGPQGPSVGPSPPLDAAFCVNSASLASFLSYFTLPDGHSGQDLRNSYPFELEENGKHKIYYPPRKSQEDVDPGAWGQGVGTEVSWRDKHFFGHSLIEVGPGNLPSLIARMFLLEPSPLSGSCGVWGTGGVTTDDKRPIRQSSCFPKTWDSWKAINRQTNNSNAKQRCFATGSRGSPRLPHARQGSWLLSYCYSASNPPCFPLLCDTL